MAGNKKKDKNKKDKRGGKGPLGGGPKQDSAKAREREKIRQIEKVESLWKKGDVGSALDLTEDLIEKDPKDARLLFMSGVLMTEAGLFEDGLERLQAADGLEPDSPMILNSLGLVYLANVKPAHALNAFRQLRLVDEKGEFYGTEERAHVKQLEQFFEDQAVENEVPRVKMEQAALFLEKGEFALSGGEYEQGLGFFQKTIDLLPNWVVARNSMASSQWQVGEAEAAIQTQKLVVDELKSEDHYALNNIIKFLYAAGRMEEARPYMERLQAYFEKNLPQPADLQGPESDLTQRAFSLLLHNTAWAIAAFDKDKEVYAVLKQGEGLGLKFNVNLLRLAGAAAWNNNQPEEALQYWKQIDEEEQSLNDEGILTAVELTRPEDAPPLRVPYFESGEFLPQAVLAQILTLNEQTGEFAPAKITEAYQRFKPYYPILAAQIQLLKFGHPMLIEATLAALSAIDLPEVRAAIKDFALGVDGSEEARIIAVSALVALGDLPEDGTVRLWSNDTAEWREIPVSEIPLFNEDVEFDDEDFDFEDEEDED